MHLAAARSLTAQRSEPRGTGAGAWSTGPEPGTGRRYEAIRAAEAVPLKPYR